MNTPILPVSAYYTIEYQPEPPVLRGGGTRTLSAEEVTESCELLLAAARQHGCAHWLVDRCSNPRALPPALYDWMQQDFFPRVCVALGRPLRLAFLVPPEECARLRRRQEAHPQDGHSPAVRVGWFSTETCARAWLQGLEQRN